MKAIDNWKTYQFMQIADNIVERVMPTSGDEEEYIGLEHMDTGSLHITRLGSENELIGEKLRIRKGDVLFARRNAYLKRVAIAPFDGIFSAHGMVLRPNTDIVAKEFFPFFVISDMFLERAIQISVGSLSPTVNWSTLKKEVFTLPPIEEQKRIAELLWAADRLIRSYYQKHERIKHSLDIYVAKTFAEGIKKHQWRVYSLEELSDIVYGITLNAAKRKGEIELPYLRVANVFREKLDLEDVLNIKCSKNEMERYQLKKNDILLVEGHADKKQIGRAAMWNKELDVCLHQNHLIRVRCGDKILPTFLLAWINSPRGRNYFYRYSQSSSGLNTINSSVVKNMSIPLCDLRTQKKICELIQRYKNALFSCEDAILKAQVVLKSLINYALQGGVN